MGITVNLTLLASLLPSREGMHHAAPLRPATRDGTGQARGEHLRRGGDGAIKFQFVTDKVTFDEIARGDGDNHAIPDVAYRRTAAVDGDRGSANATAVDGIDAVLG